MLADLSQPGDHLAGIKKVRGFIPLGSIEAKKTLLDNRSCLFHFESTS
jgi:hypothetical protein